MSGRPVPWASWEEWQTLRDALWSVDPARQECGLQQVSAWRLRGKLPLGVDATAHLMDARRADEEWQRSVGWANTTAAAAKAQLTKASAAPAPSIAAVAAATAAAAAADAAVAAGELPLRLRYSLPLIRLVNGISDSQQRGRVAASVAVLSDAAGLPRALVDVRHEATHNELPSLPLLRAAADSALAWLREYYWDAQSRALALAAERIGALLACLADSWRAAMTAGMSRAGALGAAEEVEADDEEEEPEGAGTGSGYSGPQGQRLRRQTMSELRSLVPPAFTHELLQPVLDCPVLLPPELPWQQELRQQVQLPEQGQQLQVEAAAWSAAMKHLLKWYPRLRPLLIQAALRRLVANVSPAQAPQVPAPPPPPATHPGDALAGANPREGASEGSLKRAQACMRWVLRLLPTGALQKSAQGGLQALRNDSPARRPTKKTAAAAASGGSADGSFGGGATPSLDGPLTPAQLEALLGIAVAGRGPQEGGSGSSLDGGGGDGLATAATEGQAPTSGGAAQTMMGLGTGPSAPSLPARSRPGLVGTAKTGAELRPGDAEGPEAGCLKEVVAALHRALALAIGESRGSKRRRLGSHAGGEGPPRPGESRGPGGARGGDAGGSEGLGAASGQPGAEARGAIEGQGEGEEEPQPANEERLREREQQQQRQQQHGTVRRRWERYENWSRCAIGCLPCPLNPNGRAPVLVPPPPSLPLPSTDLDGVAAPTVASGWAADAAANASTAPWGPLHQLRQQQQQPEGAEVEYYVEPEEAEGAGGDVSGGEGGGGDEMPDDEEEGQAEEEEEEDALGGEAEVAGGGSTGGGGLFGALLQHGAGHEGLGGGVGFLL